MKIKFKNTVILFVLSLFLLMFSLTSCKEKNNDKPTETTIEEKYPDVNKPVLPEGVNEEDFSFVYSSIIVDLASYGYDVFDAIADNGEEKEFGLGYTDYCQGFEDSENNIYVESSFLSFSANKDDDLTNNALTYLTPINEELDIIDEDYKYIVGYFEEGIPSGHFILNDNYIKYEVVDGIVNIEKQKNSSSNYDLSIGRMFNYDTNEYEFIPFDEIASDPIEYTPLVEEIDYSDIKNNLSEVMEEQERNGYTYESLSVAFISLDALNQMSGFASQEDKLNGFTFEELDSIKYDNSRQYIYFEEDGSVSVRDIPPIPRDNNKQLFDWIIDTQYMNDLSGAYTIEYTLSFALRYEKEFATYSDSPENELFPYQYFDRYVGTNQTYNEYNLYRKMLENAKKNVVKSYFSNTKSITMQIFTPYDENGNVRKYDDGITETVAYCLEMNTNHCIVTTDKVELSKLTARQPYINNYKFISIPQDSSEVTLTDENGNEYDIQYGISVEKQLSSQEAETSIYTVTETNQYGEESSYSVCYIAKSTVCNTELILEINGKSKFYDKNDYGKVVKDVDYFKIKSATNKYDNHSLIIIKKDNKEIFYDISKLDENVEFNDPGEYSIIVEDRMGNNYEFKIIINEQPNDDTTI